MTVTKPQFFIKMQARKNSDLFHRYILAQRATEPFEVMVSSLGPPDGEEKQEKSGTLQHCKMPICFMLLTITDEKKNMPEEELERFGI